MVRFVVMVLCLAAGACSSTSAPRTEGVAGVALGGSAAGQGGVVLRNLMTSKLEGVEGTDVVVSHVTIPPHSSLPKHWHPGEEFGYVLEGTVTLWQEGKRDIVVGRGEVVKIPLKQVHTAITGDEGVKILVFRVHKRGEPERVLAE